MRAEDKELLMALSLQLRQGYLHLDVPSPEHQELCQRGNLLPVGVAAGGASSSGVHHLSHVRHLLGDVQVKLHVARKVLYCDVIHKGSGLL